MTNNCYYRPNAKHNVTQKQLMDKVKRGLFTFHKSKTKLKTLLFSCKVRQRFYTNLMLFCLTFKFSITQKHFGLKAPEIKTKTSAGLTSEKLKKCTPICPKQELQEKAHAKK